MSTPAPITPDTLNSDCRSERRRLGGLIIGSALLSAVGVGALAYTATNAAFSGTTSTNGNSFTAATVTLTDNDFGVGDFVIAGMMPGDVATDCIEVTYTGSSATGLADMKLYGAPTGLLSDNLQLVVTHRGAGSSCSVPGGTNAVYSGGFEALPGTFALGADGQIPTAAPETVAYDFTVTLESTTADSEQGQTAGATFTWEVRSS